MKRTLALVISKTQAELFEMSVDLGLESESFIKAFMLSPIARDLDSDFNHMQWAGKEYLKERILDELKDKLKKGGEIYDRETMYWAGFLYREWHYYTGENSKEIYKQAPAKIIQSTYLGYHTMSVEMAIDRLKDAYKEKHKNRK